MGIQILKMDLSKSHGHRPETTMQSISVHLHFPFNKCPLMCGLIHISLRTS